MKCVPYESIVGSLMYVMVCTRLDIAHVVSVEQIHADTWKGALDNCQERIQVFMWHKGLCYMLPRKILK
jgi:hypothetical protein